MSMQNATTNPPTPNTANANNNVPVTYYKHPSTTIIKDLPFNERETIVKELYRWILGREPSISEIDMYIYKEYTLEQVKDMIINLPERQQHLNASKQVPQLRQKIEYLKQEMNKTLWVIKSLQEQIKVKNQIMKEKKYEIKKLRDFLKRLSKHPEGPTAFFETIYKAQYINVTVTKTATASPVTSNDDNAS